jgi:hypothetical protein
MIKIIKDDNQLLLKYKSDGYQDASWVDRELQSKKYVTIRRVFTFKTKMRVVKEFKSNYLSKDTRFFLLGVADGDFYKINKNILGLKYDLLLSREMTINGKTFIANRDISVFHKIDNLINEQIIIGGDTENSIPITEFEELLLKFPTTTELTHYSNSRITRILKDYLGTISDAQKKLNTFLNKKSTIRVPLRFNTLQKYEARKYEYVRDELREVLKNPEEYAEKDWQKLITNFLLLIFPKYITVLENLRIKDFYSNPDKPTNRYIDLTLVDANGTIDIIEIKKPYDSCLLSSSKYRDNYTPKKELSGSVMQVEKYIFYLNKLGRSGEQDILKKRCDELPPNFDIKITNPKAMIILGRDTNFVEDQKLDFEIIKRKFANIIEIMTYDDLLRRLDNIIAMLTIKQIML